jgi:ATP-dependent helicase/nuclease subunit B
MELPDDRIAAIALPAGEGFFDALAAAIFERCSSEVDRGDLSSLRVLVPALPLSAELLAALRRAAQRPLLLPRCMTLTQWAETLPARDAPLPDSERLVLLHEALRQRGWFDEAALWGIAAELAALFDELTAAALTLPDDAAALEAQLQRAYDLRACAPLAFEARVVHELWRALASSGRLDAAAAYRLRLAALAGQYERGDGARRPLLVLLDAPPDEALDPAEREFLLRYGAVQPLFVFHPALRETAASPLLTTLAAAWPPALDVPPLRERAQALAAQPSALAGRLQLVAAEGREQEARAAVAQVGQWLADGLRRIALIAQDRLTARRVRALLEREGVLVSDETGWTLSTSRAAASVDALLETVAGGVYHRDLLDLCKSPYVFADVAEDARKAAVYRLEAALRGASVRSGLARMRRALLEHGDQHGDDHQTALALLDRVGAATALLEARSAPLARWIARLDQALELLGAPEPLRQDAAGQALLELLALRRAELAGSTAKFSFAAWRDWLNRQFEAATFRDATISSPVVLTPLNAVCLRRFDAALLLGGDARQLAPAACGDFFNQAVRRELGLRTRADGERELRRDLELLLATVPRVTVSWQATHDGEANLLAPELALLSTLHQLAWGDDLRRAPLPARGEAPPDAATAPQRATAAAPVAPPSLIPRRVSVSGYASLVACPYRFFARHVLRLGELEEVAEEMAKSDYGALVHRVLERFHGAHPVVSDLSEDEALSALQRCVDEVFAAAVADNFLETGWRLRWEQRLPAYLDWQRAVEARGWRWAQAETKVSRILPIGTGDGADSVEFHGRIDRVDRRADGVVALFDYKTQSAKAIRDRLPDDVQLPAYALLYGGDCAQAAYVALDDEVIVEVAAGADEGGNDGGALMADAQAQGARLQSAFAAMHGGARLPAHGAESVCAWCEMSGLCRRDHV